MRQIAYLTESGGVQTRDLDSGESVEISGHAGEEVVCAWPTWSPDGKQLAYFEYLVRRGEVRRASVVVADVDSHDRRVAYEPSGGGLVYMAWSPDGRWLTVLEQQGNQLSLCAIDWREGRAPITVAQGAPLYFCWTPDSTTVVTHVGTERIGSASSRLIWVTIANGHPQPHALSGSPAPGFRAPAWSHLKASVTLALDADDGAEIALLEEPAGRSQVIAQVGESPAFSWSPDGATLALVDRNATERGSYRRLAVFRDGALTQLAEEPMLAFFWCPDSRRLVYVTGEVANRAVRVRLVEADTAQITDAGWVRPTRDLMQLISHFDQYVQSSVIVSPGGELLLSASRATELENGPVPTVRQIRVRNLETGEDAVVARGRLASWRPSA